MREIESKKNQLIWFLDPVLTNNSIKTLNHGQEIIFLFSLEINNIEINISVSKKTINLAL